MTLLAPAVRAPAIAGDEDLVALLRDLVACPSFSGEEAAVQRLIVDWFAAEGIAATLEPADGGLTNVVLEIEGAHPGPTLWIGGHCDTVGIAKGWTREPHRPTIEGGRLYGLGACDMKGGLAAAMVAVRDLARRRDEWSGRLIFAALADEEAWSRGANAHVRNLRGVDAAIMCEPHFHDAVIGAMGKINLRVEARGRSAHGSRPNEGVNAVTEAARLLVAIDGIERRAHPKFGPANHCVLGVTSGDGRYEISVPDRCRFVVNWQFMPGETIAEAVETIETLARDLNSPAEFVVEVGDPRYESYLLVEDHPFVRRFAEVCARCLGRVPELKFGRGVSDGNIFAGRSGIPTILFGPRGAGLHSADEWVDLESLADARRLYVDLAIDFLVSEGTSFE